MTPTRTPFALVDAHRSRPRGRLSLSTALGFAVALLGLGASTAAAQRTVPVEVSNGSPIPVVVSGVSKQTTTSTTVCMDMAPTCAPVGAALQFGCFPAESLALGASRAESAEAGTTRTRGDATIGELVLRATPGSYSPKLFESVVKARVSPRVSICVADAASGESLLQYELTNASIVGWESVVGAASPDGGPEDEISLDFEEIRYVITTATGNIEVSWKIDAGI